MTKHLPSGLTAIALLSVAAALSGCIGFHEPDSFSSGDPAGRMNAARLADARGDRTAIPDLVHMLSSDDPAERMVAIGSLEKLTGQRLGYDPTAPAWARAEGIDRWNAWLAKGGEGVNDPATVRSIRTDHEPR